MEGEMGDWGMGRLGEMEEGGDEGRWGEMGGEIGD
jgi:hypothetical protein